MQRLLRLKAQDFFSDWLLAAVSAVSTWPQSEDHMMKVAPDELSHLTALTAQSKYLQCANVALTVKGVPPWKV